MCDCLQRVWQVALEHERKESQDKVDLQEYHMNRLEEVPNPKP